MHGTRHVRTKKRGIGDIRPQHMNNNTFSEMVWYVKEFGLQNVERKAQASQCFI